jgi:hypothetical protein
MEVEQDFMNGLVRFFRNFFQYTFIDSKTVSNLRTVPIEEANIEESRSPESQMLSKDQVQAQLILTINRVLVGVFCVSFVVIIIYPFVYPDKSVPDIIQNVFCTTLGWFGNALGTFFQVAKSKE